MLGLVLIAFGVLLMISFSYGNLVGYKQGCNDMKKLIEAEFEKNKSKENDV